MINIRRAVATITTTATTALLLACSPTPASTATICATGYRGQPAYDRACLTTGTPRTASDLWDAVPEGRAGRERDDMTTQRGICRYAYRHGGIMVWSRELVADMTYDSYRNHETINTWVGQDAALTCAQLGYRVR